jgi:hypothetical protein
MQAVMIPPPIASVTCRTLVGIVSPRGEASVTGVSFGNCARGGGEGPDPYTPQVRRPVRSSQFTVLVILAAALGTVAVVLNRLGMRLFYPDLLTTVAVMVLSVVATLLARRLLPESWRPSGWGPMLVAALGAYLFVRFGVATDASEFVDHDLLEPLGGEVDDSPTWLFAALGAIGTMVALRMLTRRTGRPSPRDEDPPAAGPAARPAPREG